jgi:hypothetical protein
MKADRRVVATVLSCGAFLLLGGAPAWATSIPSVTINGVPQAQSKIQVTVGTNNQDSRLAIFNTASNGSGNAITSVSGVLAPGGPPLGYATFNSPLPDGETLWGNDYISLSCTVNSGTTFQCSGLNVQPGDEQTIFLVASNPSQSLSDFQSVDVEINNGTLGACPTNDAIFVAHAADNCSPPSHTKITSAKIEGDKAFFTFKAQNATGYRCELVQAKTKKLMFDAPCDSGSKPYSHSLPAGKYAFVVTGTNAAGYDKLPAVKVFTAT